MVGTHHFNLFQIKSSIGGREFVPSSTISCTETTSTTTSVTRFRSPLLDIDLSLDCQVAWDINYCPTRDCLGMASPRLEDLLAMVFTTARKRRTPSHRSWSAVIDPAHGEWESIVGSTQNSGGVGATRVHRLCLDILSISPLCVRGKTIQEIRQADCDWISVGWAASCVSVCSLSVTDSVFAP